ncbi:MAG: hypothetical protein AAGN82_10280 [Myxococcota bacterium]
MAHDSSGKKGPPPPPRPARPERAPERRFSGTLMGFRPPEDQAGAEGADAEGADGKGADEEGDGPPTDKVMWGGGGPRRRTTVKMTKEDLFGINPPPAVGQTIPQGSPPADDPGPPATARGGSAGTPGQAYRSGPTANQDTGPRPAMISNPALTGGTTAGGAYGPANRAPKRPSYQDVESYPPAPTGGPGYVPPGGGYPPPAAHAGAVAAVPPPRPTVPMAADAPTVPQAARPDLAATVVMNEGPSAAAAVPAAPAAVPAAPTTPTADGFGGGDAPIDPDSSAAIAAAVAFHAGRLNLPAARRYAGAGSGVEPAPPVAMNKWIYRSVIYGCLAAAAGLFAATYDPAAGDTALAIGFAWIPLVPAMMMHFLLVHRMWRGIQDSQARMTPGRAVGFTFIPLFNLYWVFEVFPGFATDYNAYLERHRIQAPPMSRGLFLAMVLLPGVNFILYWIVVGRICDGVTRLSEP